MFFKGKKGFFLTLLAVVLSAMFVTLFSAKISNLPDYKVDVIEGRVSLMNYYMENFFAYAEGAGTISGYSALQGMLSEMYNGGINKHYNNNFTKEFPNCVKFGNLTNTTVSPGRTCPNMASRTLDFFLQNLSLAAQKELKINTTYLIDGVSVTQTEDPFMLELNMNLTVHISDLGVSSIATMNSTRHIVSYIPITGLDDPIYLVSGGYRKIIKRANMSKIDGTWVAADLVTLVNTSSYRFTKYGITFIYRMQGNFTPSGEVYNGTNPNWIDLGIESFVDHTHPSVSSNNNANYSFVDYLYWNKTSFDCTAFPYSVMKIDPTDIKGIASGFQLDAIHTSAFFNLTRNASQTSGCT